MKYGTIILIFAFLVLKLTTATSPIGLGALWDIGFIVIYNYDELTEDAYKELLAHELRHQLAWDLWGIYPSNIYDHDSCCFI